MPGLLSKPTVSVALCLLVISVQLLVPPVEAAPKAQLIPYWNTADKLNKTRIDHSAWGRFLQRYASEHPSGINRMNYAGVSSRDARALDNYLSRMQAVLIRHYNRDEQFAYWVNLYNAATVKVVLDRYPVTSIRKVSYGLFNFGPWNNKLLKVEKQPLSLNDIEHGILRPIWRDKRIHYAVNCASLGCPNLALEPFDATRMEAQLSKAERDYVHHRRGFSRTGNSLTLSSIYTWYQVDFGDSPVDVVRSLLGQFTLSKKEQQSWDKWFALPDSQRSIDYTYDWALNKP